MPAALAGVTIAPWRVEGRARHRPGWPAKMCSATSFRSGGGGKVEPRSHPNRREAVGSGPGIPRRIPAFTALVLTKHERRRSVGFAGPARHEAAGPRCVHGVLARVSADTAYQRAGCASGQGVRRLGRAAVRTTRGGPITVETRINDRIRVPEVRLVGPNGEQVGIVRIEDALRLAQEADLDLVEVAAQARPPVCKLMDFGKFKYETAQKARESRRNQQMTVIKEQKLRPKIDAHDYETKKRHVVRFLDAGHKVKVTIMFRGREQSRPELGFRLLQRLSDDVAELGFVETSAKQDGRNMTMVLAPHRNKPRGVKVERGTAPPAERQPAEQQPAEQQPAQ